MLITNGIVTRNINAKNLAEYTAKGYTEVKAPVKAPVKGKGTAKA